MWLVFKETFLKVMRMPAERVLYLEINPKMTTFGAIGVAVGPFVNYFYGDGRENIIMALLLVLIMDWITGITAAHKENVYTSEYGIEGMFRSLYILMFPAVANLIDQSLKLHGSLFYAITFGLLYHILQSVTANTVRAKWDRWVPESIIKLVSSEIHAKQVRTERRKKEILSTDEKTSFQEEMKENKEDSEL